MKIGGTLMSSLLFNVNLIMLSSIAVIQFCAQAFDGYAIDTEVSNIFGGEIQNLKGLGVLYEDKVFIYCFFAIACVSFLYLIQGEARGEGKKKKKSYLSASDDA
jgi:LMBR1 domain-containing protein 1